jgi:hypothetical protein
MLRGFVLGGVYISFLVSVAEFSRILSTGSPEARGFRFPERIGGSV